MPQITKKGLFSLFLFVLLVATLAGRHYIKEQTILWILRSKSEAHFGLPISYEKFQLEKNRLVLDGVVLIDTLSDVDGGYFFRARSIEVNYDLDLWQRQLHMDVAIVAPECTVVRKKIGVLPPFPFNPNHPKLLSVESQLSIQEGQIELNSRIPGEETLQRIFVSFEGKAADTIGGDLLLTFDAFATGTERTIQVALEGNELSGTADILVHSVDCNDMARATQFFLGEGIQAWAVPEGEANGRFIAVYGSDHQPRFDGELNLQNLQFAHSALAVQGEVGEARLQLFDTYSLDEQSEISGMPLGRLEIISDGRLAFFKEGEPQWEVQHLSGGMYLDAKEASRVELNGICLKQGEPSRLHIEGETLLLGVERPYANLDVRLGTSPEEEVQLKFRAEQIDAEKRSLELSCRNIGKAECDVLLNLFPCEPEEQKLLIFKEGLFNGSFRAWVFDNTIHQVDIQGLEAQDLRLIFPKWGLTLGCDELVGNLSGNLAAENLLTSLNSEIRLVQGSVNFRTPKGHQWELSDIETELVVKEGIVDSSKATATFAGLRGDLILDWQASDKIVGFDFSGAAKDLIPFIPQPLQNKLRRGFENDHLTISADVQRNTGALEVTGLLKVKSSSQAEDHIHFGFDLAQVAEGLWGNWNNGSPEKQALCQQSLLNIRALTPVVAAPSTPLLNRWLEDEFGVYGFIIRDGWFYGKNLPVHKYVEPLVFADERISFTGFADVKGDFFNQNLRIRYQAENLQLETPHFKWEIPEVGDFDSLEKGKDVAAVHYFDLSHNQHFGSMSIAGTTYTDKKYGLVFEQLETEVLFDNRQIHCTNMQALSEGVYFSGRVDLDFMVPGDSETLVQFDSSEISGTLSQLESILAHINPSFALGAPIDGQFISPNHGAFFKLFFQPDTDTDIELYMLGSISEGSASFNDRTVLVENLTTNFDYSLKEDVLVFTDIDANVSIGNEETGQDAYFLKSKEVRILNFPQYQVEFDVRLEDELRDIVRLEGMARSLEDPLHGPVVAFDLNPQHTHLGELRPHVNSLVLHGWSKVISFAASPELNLSTVIGDLSRFAKTGWMGAYDEGFQSLQLLDIAGLVHAKVHLDPKTSYYHFTAECNNLSLDDKTFTNCFLSGKKAGDQWSVDQLQVDEMSLAADIQGQKDGWKLNFLGMRYADTALLGLEGKFLLDERVLKSRLNLFEIDLEKARKLPIPEEWLSALDLQGKLRASGQVNIVLENDSDPIHVLADLKASYRDLSLAGIEFNNQEGIPFLYDSDRGIQVGRMQVTVKNSPDKPGDIALWIDSVSIDPIERLMDINELSFNIPAQQLPWLAQTLQASIPIEVSEEVSRTLSQLKEEGEVIGSLDLQLSPTYYKMKLYLNEDRYYVMNDYHELRGFTFTYNPYELLFSTEYKVKGKYCWITGRTAGTSLDAGRLFIGVNETDLKVLDESLFNPLTAYWKWDEDLGMQIQRVDGEYKGLTFNLNQSEDNVDKTKILLVGQVGIDAQMAKGLLPPALEKAVERWDVGKGFELSGDFLLNKGGAQGAFNFDGILVGRDFDIKNYQLNTLFAQMRYREGNLEIDDFKILDAAGQFRMDELRAWTERGDWKLNIPLIVLEDFRPSLLQEKGVPPKRPKPLNVTHLEVRDLKGNLADLESMTGDGYLHFVNPKKKNIRNTLLVIPQDILSRIGLDLDVLTPVGGAVDYTIGDGRVYIDHMRDVYSEGRLSKFYIPSGRYRSSMDFEGNLDLQVRMKQYNLIFKITELLTITVRGTVADPSYTLQKQQPNSKQQQRPEAQGEENELLIDEEVGLMTG